MQVYQFQILQLVVITQTTIHHHTEQIAQKGEISCCGLLL